MLSALRTTPDTGAPAPPVCDAARRVGASSSAVPQCTRAVVAGEVVEDYGIPVGPAGIPARIAHPIMLASFVRATELFIAAMTMVTGSTAAHSRSRAGGARDRLRTRSMRKAACSDASPQKG